MRNLTDFALRLEYERVKDLGDKLVDIGGRLTVVLQTRAWSYV